jgi:predicted transcriptional regulator
VKTPCEIIVEKFLPQIRSMVALELKERYNLRGTAIADLIGCSEAAVSQYLHGIRGAQGEFSKDFPEIQGFVESVSKELYERREEGMELTEKLGEICATIRNNKLFIEMYSKGKSGKSCGICLKEIE